MRVGIDICDLASGIVGVGSVIVNTLRYLDTHDVENQYFLYQNDDVVYSKGNNFIYRKAQLPQYAYWYEQLFFTGRCVFDNLDVFHAPIHIPPFFKPHKTKVVFSVQDLHVELDAENYPAAMQNYFVSHRLKAIEKADAVIVNTNQVRDDVLRLSAVSPERVHVLPLGVKEDFLLSYDDQVKEQHRQKYGLPEKYILYVGSVEPWKRVPFLLEVFRELVQAIDESIALVIVGRRGCSARDNQLIADAARDHDDVFWFDAVGQDDLPCFYANAAVFCSASIREGFGLIFLEAMAQGVPVVGADATSVTETVGTAGLLCSCDDREAFVAALRKLLENTSVYQDMQEKGRQWIQKYSWDAYGKAVHQLYESLCG